MKSALNVLDLFSGCGGFSLGAHQAGFNVAMAVDVDPILTSSFRTNFPRTPLVLHDIAQLSGRDVLNETGPIDGVFGGPPCQAFSAIGHKRADDPRRELLVHFFRLVSEIRPAFFVAENVQGLQLESAQKTLNKGLDYVRQHYRILGPILLNAADYGAATKRPRLFIIGIDSDRCDVVSSRQFELAKRAPATVRQAIGDLENASFVENSGGFDYWKINRPGRPARYAEGLRAPTGEFTGHMLTTHTKEVRRRFSKVKQGEVDRVGRHPRLSWEGQCPTLRAGTGNDRGSYQAVRPLHPTEHRVITVREAARLQGFPDTFKFHPTTWHSFRMIGNSVSPIMARSIFDAMASAMGRVPTGLAAE